MFEGKGDCSYSSSLRDFASSLNNSVLGMKLFTTSTPSGMDGQGGWGGGKFYWDEHNGRHPLQGISNQPRARQKESRRPSFGIVEGVALASPCIARGFSHVPPTHAAADSESQGSNFGQLLIPRQTRHQRQLNTRSGHQNAIYANYFLTLRTTVLGLATLSSTRAGQ